MHFSIRPFAFFASSVDLIVPSSCSSVRRGDTIRFTATFERSRDDEAFGFFKRPTQATYSKAPENPYNPYNPYEA